MRYQLHLFLCSILFSVFCYSQKHKKTITGKVFFDSDVIADVHIINKNSNTGTNSNDLGLFEIQVVLGDTLLFSHINVKDKKIAINKKVLNQEILKIDLESKTYELEEITLEKPKSIFYIDPEIVPPSTVNAKTLNLPYANTKAKRDDAIIKFRSGGVISLDNLINSLNGNNRRRKLLEKITREDKVLAKIRKHFTDDFFITDLNIKKEDINPFLNYCFKKNIINYYKKENLLKVTTILMRESKTFPQDKIEISLLKKDSIFDK